MVTLKGFVKGDSKKVFNKLSKKEQDIILDFVKYVSINSKSERRLENNKRNIVFFRYVLNKPIDKITLNDLRDFLARLNTSTRTQSSKNDLKHTIKRFLKWHYKDWSLRFNNLDDVKLFMGMNEEKINAETLLRKDDIEKIVKEEPRLFWKTFFITLYESALRPIELRNLLWKNIKFDIEQGGLTEINIFATKTLRARSVYVKESTFYLKKLKETSDSDLVFPSPKDKTKPMTKELPAMWLKRISLKVLGRPVYPYILRHSRATELYTNAQIPDKVAQKFLGHSKSMGDVYTHLSNKDVKEAVGKTIYQTQHIPPKQRNEIKELHQLLITSIKNSIALQNAATVEEREKVVKEMKGVIQYIFKKIQK